MNESIYAPPEADVTAPTTDQPRYYVVSPTKFMLLSVLTLTLYFVYWFYKNWKLIKDADKEDTWPPVRGFFYIFFTHSLFSDVQSSLEGQQRSFGWNPTMLATLFVILTVVLNVGDRVLPIESIPVLAMAMPFVGTIIVSALLLQAQKAINFAAADVGGTGNAKLTAINWVWMLLGGALWLLALIGIFAVATDPTLS
ncbi:MAG: hypothetical protein HKP05_00375 [Woeseiaceae bacterium]|nr:hypothetical protein [Gammaproteobacteria bacterium]NNK24077.1 hypothetical protein [Woeseiaceae bacterium]